MNEQGARARRRPRRRSPAAPTGNDNQERIFSLCSRWSWRWSAGFSPICFTAASPAMAALAQRAGALSLLLHKYWIDEIYSALIVVSPALPYPLRAVGRGRSRPHRRRRQSSRPAACAGWGCWCSGCSRETSVPMPVGWPSAPQPCSSHIFRLFHAPLKDCKERFVLNDSILTLTTFVPAAGAVVVALLPRRGRVIQWFTLAVTLLIFG